MYLHILFCNYIINDGLIFTYKKQNVPVHEKKPTTVDVGILSRKVATKDVIVAVDKYIYYEWE